MLSRNGVLEVILGVHFRMTVRFRGGQFDEQMKVICLRLARRNEQIAKPGKLLKTKGRERQFLLSDPGNYLEIKQLANYGQEVTFAQL